MIIRSGEEDEEKIGFGYEFGSVKLGYEITTEENKITSRLNNVINEEDPTGVFTKTTSSDALGRTVSDVLTDLQSNGELSATYEYVRGTVTDSNGNAAATDLVSKITYSDGSERLYTYDANGNILTVSLKNSSTSAAKTEASYTYDELGQLIRQDCSYSVINITVIYEYDSNGNILSKKEYKHLSSLPMPEEPTSTVVYGYSDTSWKDKLTSYNGEEITYDANGNPLSYRDGISLAWKNGRSLAELNNGAKNTKTTYTYNEDGIRIMKDFEGIKTRYLLDGTNIIAQEVTNGDSLDYIYFFYDASGSPVGMNYLGNNYFYKKNLQGDIIEIWGTEDGTDNHTFRRLVEYTYDAWGNVTKMLDQTNGWYRVGTANPFRYRGYYYDNESGFYYLQSRYYDPVTGRFLNADDYCMVGVFGDFNLFSYCGNRFVQGIDRTGQYDYNQAVKYLKKWFYRRNTEYYYYYRGDCANFISQCLFAGGIPMDNQWHSYRYNNITYKNFYRYLLFTNSKYDWDVGASWRLANLHYKYFSNPANRNTYGTIMINSPDKVWLYACQFDLRKGDIIYFAKRQGGDIYHVAMITAIKNQDIYYGAHTTNCCDRSLKKNMKNDCIYIVRVGVRR